MIFDDFLIKIVFFSPRLGAATGDLDLAGLSRALGLRLALGFGRLLAGLSWPWLAFCQPWLAFGQPLGRNNCAKMGSGGAKSKIKMSRGRKKSEGT